MKYRLTFYILLIITQFVYSQSFKSLIKLGDKAFKKQDYITASGYYRKAYLQNPIDKLTYKLAECEYWKRNYKESLRLFKEVRKREKNNKNKKEKLTNYYIALNYKSLGNYKRAFKSFKRYYRANRKTRDNYTLKAKHEMTSCQKALEYQLEADSSLLITKKIFSEGYSNLQYNVFGKSDTLLLSKHPINKDDDLILSRLFKVDGERLDLLDTAINKPYFQIGSFCKASPYELYLSACVVVNGKSDCSIYKSQKQDGKWMPIRKLPQVINEDGSKNIHPFVFKQDSKTYLVFASDRKGGLGGFDLYYSELTDKGFSKVKNLGKRINSVENEITPTYDTIRQRLYFSSQWFNNLGGYDIFYSGGVFPDLESPENMGLPINSSYDDLYYTWSDVSGDAYFSSNRLDPESSDYSTCCNHIFSYHFMDVPVDTLTDSVVVVQKIDEMEKLIPIDLYFDNDRPNPKTLDTLTNLDYEQTYQSYFKKISKYESAFSKGLKDEDKQNAILLIDDFFYDKLERGFDKLQAFNLALLRILKEGYDVDLIVKGFASPLNSSKYNVNLSKRRVCSIINYYQKVDDGVFRSFIESGSLRLKEEAFGESTSSKQVSDDRKDVRNSVYSPSAAEERRVRIIAFKLKR